MPSNFASTFDSYMDIMDAMVAQSRAARASLDRYQGALLLGLPNEASARLNEANGFVSLLRGSFQNAKNNLPSIINMFDVLYPGILDEVVTKSMMIDIRDSIAAGVFPSVEQTALSAWGVTNTEKAFLTQRFSSLANGDIDSFFLAIDPIAGNSTSFRNALIAGTDFCATCLPEPSTISLFGVGIAWMLKCRKRLHRGSQDNRNEAIGISA